MTGRLLTRDEKISQLRKEFKEMDLDNDNLV